MGRLSPFASAREEFAILSQAIETHKDELGDKYESLHALAEKLTEKGQSEDKDVVREARNELADACVRADLPITREELHKGLNDVARDKEIIYESAMALKGCADQMTPEERKAFTEAVEKLDGQRLTRDDRRELHEKLDPIIKRLEIDIDIRERISLDSKIKISRDEIGDKDPIARLLNNTSNADVEAKARLDERIAEAKEKWEDAKDSYGYGSFNTIIRKIQYDTLRIERGDKTAVFDVVVDFISLTQSNIIEFALKAMLHAIFVREDKPDPVATDDNDGKDFATKPDGDGPKGGDVVRESNAFDKLVGNEVAPIDFRDNYLDAEGLVDSLKGRISELQMVLKIAPDSVSAENREIYEGAVQTAKEVVREADRVGLGPNKMGTRELRNKLYNVDQAISKFDDGPEYRSAFRDALARIDHFNAGRPDTEKLSFNEYTRTFTNADGTTLDEYLEKGGNISGFSDLEKELDSLKEIKAEVVRPEDEPRDMATADGKPLEDVEKPDAVSREDAAGRVDSDQNDEKPDASERDVSRDEEGKSREGDDVEKDEEEIEKGDEANDTSNESEDGVAADGNEPVEAADKAKEQDLSREGDEKESAPDKGVSRDERGENADSEDNKDKTDKNSAEKRDTEKSEKPSDNTARPDVSKDGGDKADRNLEKTKELAADVERKMDNIALAEKLDPDGVEATAKDYGDRLEAMESANAVKKLSDVSDPAAKDAIDRLEAASGRIDAQEKAALEKIEGAIEKFNANASEADKVELKDDVIRDVKGEVVNPDDFAARYENMVDGERRLDVVRENLNQLEGRVETVDAGERMRELAQNKDVDLDQKGEMEQLRDKLFERLEDLNPNDVERIEALEKDVADLSADVNDKFESAVESIKEAVEKHNEKVNNENQLQVDKDGNIKDAAGNDVSLRDAEQKIIETERPEDGKDRIEVEKGDVDKPETAEAAPDRDAVLEKQEDVQPDTAEARVEAADDALIDKDPADVIVQAENEAADVEKPETDNDAAPLAEQVSADGQQEVEKAEMPGEEIRPEEETDSVDVDEFSEKVRGVTKQDDDDIDDPIAIYNRKDDTDTDKTEETAVDNSDANFGDIDINFEDLLPRTDAAVLNGEELRGYLVENPEGTIQGFMEDLEARGMGLFEATDTQLEIHQLIEDAAANIFDWDQEVVSEFLYGNMVDSEEGLMKAFDSLSENGLFTSDQLDALADNIADIVTNELFGDGSEITDIVAVRDVDGGVTLADNDMQMLVDRFGEDFANSFVDYLSQDSTLERLQDFVTYDASPDGFAQIEINEDNMADIVRDILRPDTDFYNDVANDGLHADDVNRDLINDTGLPDDALAVMNETDKLPDVDFREDVPEPVTQSDFDDIGGGVDADSIAEFFL